MTVPIVRATWPRVAPNLLSPCLAGAVFLALVGLLSDGQDAPTPAPTRWRSADGPYAIGAAGPIVELRPGGKVAVLAADGDERATASWPEGGPPSDRPVELRWADGPWQWTYQIRTASDGSLTGLLVGRDRDAKSPVRVREARLVPDEAGRVVQTTARPRQGPAATVAPRRTARGERVGLFVVGADGSGLRSVAPPEGFVRAAQPCWSPDGRSIAFVGFDSTGREPMIRVVSAEGGPSTAVAAGLAPSWSRDGDRLAYMASGQTANATDWERPGRNEERIEVVRLVGPKAGEVEVVGPGLWPRWSPIDDRIAYVSWFQSNWEVFVRTADGLGVTRLTDDPALDSFPLWAPDGGSVIFLSNRANRWDLYSAPADGREPATRLTNHRSREQSAAISPDARSVAFTDELARPNSQILVLDLAGGTTRVLIASPDGDRDPAWSPDGRLLAFVSRRPSLPPTAATPRP